MFNNEITNILILEDNKFRIEKFKEMLNKEGINLFFTDEVSKAEELMKERKFDLFFLDHDLDQRIYVPSDEENTGYSFAKKMVDYFSKEEIKKPFVYIHSLNPAGVNNIYNILTNNGFNCSKTPFTNLF